jgi:hypothetical protein
MVPVLPNEWMVESVQLICYFVTTLTVAFSVMLSR